MMMAETQKAKIARLEKELAEEKEKVQKAYESSDVIYNKLLKLQEQADQGFESSPHFRQLVQEIERLKEHNKALEHELQLSREKADRQAELLLQSEKVHNARGAGRKRKFTDEQVQELKQLREQGLSFANIANRMGCSVGLVYKLINE